MRIAQTLDFVAGWPGLVSEKEPERWLDGCHRAVFIMDGDNGRDFSKSGRPETTQTKEVRQRFRGLPLKLYVLQRYGIENYFPQRIVERVLGRNLSFYFAIPETIPVEDHFIEKASGQKLFIKNLHTGPVGEQLTLADVAGTDLEDILKRVVQEAQDISVD